MVRGDMKREDKRVRNTDTQRIKKRATIKITEEERGLDQEI